jgi:hypothetical protein
MSGFFKNTTDAVLNDGELHCPKCACRHIHHDAVAVYDRGEDDVDVTITRVQTGGILTQRIKNEYSDNPSIRRHGLTISFWCEGCDNENEPYKLNVVQHKGTTYVFWGER